MSRTLAATRRRTPRLPALLPPQWLLRQPQQRPRCREAQGRANSERMDAFAARSTELRAGVDKNASYAFRKPHTTHIHGVPPSSQPPQGPKYTHTINISPTFYDYDVMMEFHEAGSFRSFDNAKIFDGKKEKEKNNRKSPLLLCRWMYDWFAGGRGHLDIPSLSSCFSRFGNDTLGFPGVVSLFILFFF